MTVPKVIVYTFKCVHVNKESYKCMFRWSIWSSTLSFSQPFAALSELSRLFSSSKPFFLCWNCICLVRCLSDQNWLHSWAVSQKSIRLALWVRRMAYSGPFLSITVTTASSGHPCSNTQKRIDSYFLRVCYAVLWCSMSSISLNNVQLADARAGCWVGIGLNKLGRKLDGIWLELNSTVLAGHYSPSKWK